jgi:hypothetical protein
MKIRGATIRLLELTLLTHPRFISCTLSTFPKPTPGFTDKDRVTETAVFWAVVLFARTETAIVVEVSKILIIDFGCGRRMA